jgi:hypothetical protein
VGIEDPTGLGQVRLLPKVNRLGELNDAMMGKGGNNPFTKALMRQEEIAEVPPAVQKNETILPQTLHQATVDEAEPVRRMHKTCIDAAKVSSLAQPKRTIADVRMIREIEESARGSGGDQVVKCLVNLPGE